MIGAEVRIFDPSFQWKIVLGDSPYHLWEFASGPNLDTDETTTNPFLKEAERLPTREDTGVVAQRFSKTRLSGWDQGEIARIALVFWISAVT